MKSKRRVNDKKNKNEYEDLHIMIFMSRIVELENQLSIRLEFTDKSEIHVLS